MTEDYFEVENNTQEIDFRQLLFRQIERINKAGSKEFVGGVVDYNRETGEPVYISSPEEEKINGIRCLKQMLNPFLDEEYHNAILVYIQLYRERKQIYDQQIADCKIRNDKLKIISAMRSEKIKYYDVVYQQLLCCMDRMGLLLGISKATEEI
jgi:hypothetical protein